MNFQDALKEMKLGKKIRLPSWTPYYFYFMQNNAIYLNNAELLKNEIVLNIPINEIFSEYWEIYEEKINYPLGYDHITELSEKIDNLSSKLNNEICTIRHRMYLIEKDVQFLDSKIK